MSISSVRSEIQKSMVATGCSGAHITAQEMSSITKKALSDKMVSAGEARQIADLVEKGIVQNPGMMTMACPEHHGSSFTIDSAAVKAGNAMFAQNALPYGANEAVMRDKIEARLDAVDLGPSIKKPSMRGLHPLTIRDSRPVDGPLVEAFVEPGKNRVFVKVTGSGFGGPDTMIPTWHGPISVDFKEKEISTATQKKLVKATAAALAHGTHWHSSAPIGARMVRVPLFAEKHPDGYSYAALIPVGALAPGAPMADPNKAKSFYIEKTGGFAGITQVSDLIKV